MCTGARRDITRQNPIVSTQWYKRRRIIAGITYTWTKFLGTINRSFPTRPLPVAAIRFSPLGVSGRSVIPVCRPLRDHSVSPWRMMKQRGSGISFLFFSFPFLSVLWVARIKRRRRKSCGELALRTCSESGADPGLVWRH